LDKLFLPYLFLYITNKNERFTVYVTLVEKNKTKIEYIYFVLIYLKISAEDQGAFKRKWL